MAAVDGVPGMAQGAIQGGKYVATAIKSELKGADPLEREPFEYFDKGSMATVSRFSAVAQIGPLEFGGFIAWLAWLVLHLVYLVGFKRKVTTLLSWTVTFLGRARGNLYYHRAAGLRPHPNRGAPGDRRRRRGRKSGELTGAQPVALPGGQAAAVGEFEHGAQCIGGDVRVAQFAHGRRAAHPARRGSPTPRRARCGAAAAAVPSTSACSDPDQKPCRSSVLPI